MDTAGTVFQVNLYTNGGNNFHFNFIDPNKMVVASDLIWSGIINVDAFDSSFNHLWNNTIINNLYIYIFIFLHSIVTYKVISVNMLELEDINHHLFNIRKVIS